MDDKDNGLNTQQDYSSSLHLKNPSFGAMYPKASNQYTSLEDEELGEEEVATNVVRMIGKDNCDDDDDDDDDDDEDTNTDDEDENDEDKGIVRPPRKKRKFRTIISNYEFAARVRTPVDQKAKISQSQSQKATKMEQNSLGGWTEVETFALLDAWGERFLRVGRKSLRAEEWKEVAEKVSQETNIERTDAQCRNRLDTLKKKYKKEKTKLMGGENGSSKWVFYKKMDMLLSSSTQQQMSLSCGVDSGEYVFMNPNVYLNRANGLDEMKDSPANSESQKDEEEDIDGVQPKGKRKKRRRVEGSSVGLLADSIQKFSEIYEDIETNKRKQMVELENMRMDFYRQLETQRREILERAQAEIAKIRQGHDDENENDLSAENLSG
ncbi:Trihelix transcription factor ASIL2 [Bienertia sinuspersici]